MATMLTIGDFSRMTHLSVKALRHYHDLGVLEPAAVDPFTGYRSYDTSQVGSAQVIRRLRDLGMPLDSIAAVLAAPDLEARNREIAAHLARMERQLEQTQASVAALRALLTGPAVRPAIELRAIPAVTALAVREVVDAAELTEWGAGAFEALAQALTAAGLTAAGPYGALYPGDFFELERSEITVFLPVTSDGGGPGGAGLDRAGRVRLLEIPAVEAAVAVHQGAFSEIDRTYGAVGAVVAERAIGVDGPIREYYLVSSADTDDVAKHRTEVCWPVFRTGAASGERSL
jgi:DNA-binding transcriptional MerR regulator/effector-binding domain-containing protein